MAKRRRSRKSQAERTPDLAQRVAKLILTSSVQDQSDLISLLDALTHPDDLEKCHRMFWEFERPRSFGSWTKSLPTVSNRRPEDLPDDIQIQVVALLEQAESRIRDALGPPDSAREEIEARERLLCISATKARRLLALHGYGDKTQEALQAAVENGVLLVNRYRRETPKVIEEINARLPSDSDELRGPEPWLLPENELERSAVLIMGVLLCDLGAIACRSRDDASALHRWGDAFQHFIDAGDSLEYLAGDFTPNSPVPTPEYAYQDVVDAFERIRERPDADWQSLLEQVKRFLTFGDLLTDECPDFSLKPLGSLVAVLAGGVEWNWSLYWTDARAWLRGRLAPDLRRKDLLEAGHKAARARLRIYFFGRSDWAWLSRRAKDNLVTADLLLHAFGAGAIESLLDNLRIAVEEAFHVAVWLPVRRRVGDFGEEEVIRPSDLDAIVLRRFFAGVDRDGGDPGISQFRNLCVHAGFATTLRGSVHSGEVVWLQKELPSYLSDLRGARNIAGHKLGGTVDRQTVTALYRRIVGIGCEGVLSRLVRIGRALDPNLKS